MTLLKNAKINQTLCDIRIEDQLITALGKLDGEGIDLKGAAVIPGLVDVHTHGCVGIDTMDGTLEEMSRFLAKSGTTSWLPTTMTMDMDSIGRAMSADTNVTGAAVLGFHMEGPYISPKYKGAQNEKFIKKPDYQEFSDLPNSSKIKIVTIAPELEGSMEFIKKADCVVSIGHTACDYATASAAIQNGASCVTHMFNAMPPFHHRDPSVIGAAIENGIYTQMICDGLHIHKAVIMAMYRLFGSDRMVLISDSMAATGFSDGAYDFGGQAITVKDRVARTQDGAIAGSTSTLWMCVKKAVEFGIPFEQAVKMATQTPADMIGVKRGRIEVGYYGDLLVLNENLDIQQVVLGGKLI